MALTIPLPRHLFRSDPQVVCTSDGFEVTARTYPTGIQSLTIRSSRGHVEVLPFMGQIIWDAEFDGVSLRMDNMFDQPRPAASIEDTYGCFAFHAGLLAAGCPAPEDTHPLHGEFACMALDTAELVADGDQLTVRSYGEYVKGFGHHYLAAPSVTLTADASTFDIAMTVTNLSAYADMPLQYMCHMNYAFSPGARFTQSIPDDAFRLRAGETRTFRVRTGLESSPADCLSKES